MWLITYDSTHIDPFNISYSFTRSIKHQERTDASQAGRAGYTHV